MRTTWISLVLLAASAPGQSLSLGLGTSSPFSFNGGTASPPATLMNVVRTEPLVVTLDTTPTMPSSPPAQLVPRPVALYIGLDDPTPTMFPEGLVYIDLSSTAPPPVVLFDSFSDPFAPMFGPPLQGASNNLTLNFGAYLFDPVFPLCLGASPPQTLTLQAVCADTPGVGVGLILSNPVRMQLVDPETQGLGPTITGISPTEGPEAGGTTVTITGTNFLAQSDWVNFPPSLRFGSQPVTQFTVVDNNTIIAVSPPTAFPTTPPATAACRVDVVYVNNPMISCSAAAAVSPTQFLYKTGNAPTITGFDTPNGSPEGGYARQLQGSWFLDGLTVTFTSQANPSLSVTLTAPTVTAGPGGTTVNIAAMPAFCTGPVDVRVDNCDDEVSNTVTYNYDPMQPTLASGTPTVTAPAALGGATFVAINETGTNLTLNGTDYLPPSSPLATASTVIPGAFYPTRLFVDGVVDPGVIAQNGVTMNGNTAPFSATSIARPELGFKELRIENPPCVNTGTTNPISNPPCAPAAPPCTAVLQDSNPPAITDIFPAIAASTGNTYIEIRGDNFFSVQAGVTSQDFSSFAGPGGGVAAIDATQLVVPAVQFGARFAEEVEIINQQTLRVKVPQAITTAASSSAALIVHNPDLRSVTSAVAFKYVPPLTDPTSLLDPMFPELNGDTLTMLAQGMAGGPATIPVLGSGPLAAPAIAVIRNPSPNRDQLQDPLTPPPGETWSYDYVFLLNTRLPGPTPGGTRRFEFNRIDLPETIELPSGGFAFLPPIDPTVPPLFDPASEVPIPANTKIRVIIKAFGFSLGAGNRLQFDPTDNPPLVLMSHDDLVVDAMIDCAGDAFMIEGMVGQGGVTFGGPFRVRVDRTIPPAGGGQGGRGGAWFPEDLVQLPGPNFGVGPGILAGMDGFPPPGRFDAATPGSVVLTAGTAGIGAAPIGVQAGAGGGAGHVTAGGNGASGTSPGGFGGLPFGSVTNSLPIPTPGTPADDRFVFGDTPTDLTRFADGTAFTSGLLYGGSGGAGGGGGLAIFIPALTLGGRGGNGGGCVVLISNRLLVIEDGGTVLAQGERGQLGVDAFPVYNSDPVIPVNLPGAGGSGSGGTVLGLAIANVCFAYAAPGVCAPGVPGNVPWPIPAPPPGTSEEDILRQVDVSGAPSGPQISPEGLGDPGCPAGGGSGDGRVRFAISSQSPYVADFTTRLDQLFDNMPGVFYPMPPNPLMGPVTTPSYPLGYYTFPQP